MTTFSRTTFNAARYRNFRPTYAPALYDLIYCFHAENGGEFLDAVDVGTGNGQVAEALSEKFEKVHGTDRSNIMLSHAVQKPNIDYRETPAEELPFADSSVDIITSGQAFHWFDHPKFFEETKRILKPQGTLAVFGYSYAIVVGNKEASNIIYDCGVNELGPYWEPRISILNNFYRDVSFPFKNVQWHFSHDELNSDNIGSVSPLPFMEQDMTLDHFETFIKTWSSYANYREKFPDAEDPIERMARKLQEVLGLKDRDMETFKMQWPSVLVLAENDK
ncbi:S-adenosyl-L-methionine-dependent methyltransferase [Jimgerdemannia flammicorona]|uniref:S-adenosyl-L-methionine-dependent methyltransferase n=1 Tax=Jimgerdemannia flammicorona TaxID=994334 RepID=A0A433QRE6_9FUNG|nr:S-adenosyl-L-methionine-dependent methyltransferase [Jimgerdemannia flammicorona]